MTDLFSLPTLKGKYRFVLEKFLCRVCQQQRHCVLNTRGELFPSAESVCFYCQIARACCHKTGPCGNCLAYGSFNSNGEFQYCAQCSEDDDDDDVAVNRPCMDRVCCGSDKAESVQANDDDVDTLKQETRKHVEKYEHDLQIVEDYVKNFE